MGSGKLLQRAIAKHGLEHFSKEYLEIFNSEEEMNLAERIYVVIDPEVSYNLCPGGKGGFGYINERGLGVPNFRKDNASDIGRKANRKFRKMLKDDPERAAKYRANLSASLKGKQGPFLGRKHTEATKKKMRMSNKDKSSGSNNSQFGTMWITDGITSKKLNKDALIPNGWKKGRVIKK